MNRWPSVNTQLVRVGFNLEYCNPEVKARDIPVPFYSIKFLKLYIIHTGYNEEFLKYCMWYGETLSWNSRKQLWEIECIDLSQMGSQRCKQEVDKAPLPTKSLSAIDTHLQRKKKISFLQWSVTGYINHT